MVASRFLSFLMLLSFSKSASALVISCPMKAMQANHSLQQFFQGSFENVNVAMRTNSGLGKAVLQLPSGEQLQLRVEITQHSTMKGLFEVEPLVFSRDVQLNRAQTFLSVKGKKIPRSQGEYRLDVLNTRFSAQKLGATELYAFLFDRKWGSVFKDLGLHYSVATTLSEVLEISEKAQKAVQSGRIKDGEAIGILIDPHCRLVE